MEYIYSMLEYMNLKDTTTNNFKFSKPDGYKNINTSNIGKKCGNRS